jgi:hypothetical protein
MKRAKIELGEKFSRDSYRTLHSKGYPNEYTIRKQFGSWLKAVERFEQVNPQYVTEEEKQVLLYLNKAKTILGDNFKRDNYRLLKGFPSVNKVQDLFGTWSNAVNQIN